MKAAEKYWDVLWKRLKRLDQYFVFILTRIVINRTRIQRT